MNEWLSGRYEQDRSGSTLKKMRRLLGLLAAVRTVLALLFWPAADPDVMPHSHPELPKDHPHLKEGHSTAGEHVFVIADLHRTWPLKH